MNSLRRLDIPAKSLNFLKIIILKTPTIRLPKKFTEIHGGSLLDKVTLKIPNGDDWHVDLEKSNGQTWLVNGWKEFTEHYDVKFGYFLLFMYKGSSIFDVLILASTSCEIVYPEKRCSLGQTYTATRARRRLDSCEIVKIDDSEPCSSWDQVQETEIKIYGGCSSKKVDKDAKNRALEAARAKYKTNNPCFMVYMSPNHIAARSNLSIPTAFLKEHWSGLKKDQTCVLKIGRKTWETRTNNSLLLKIGGWRALMKDNGVAVSDVCIFELIDSSRNLLEVSIMKAHLLS